MGKIKLFCIPHAGASASVYYKWLRVLDDSIIELEPLELKGRGMRDDEAFYDNFECMVNDLYEMAINELSNGEKYMIFGHSMGAYAAFRLETMLEDNFYVHAEQVILSGRETPSFWKRSNKKISQLSDEDFFKEIKTYGGIDEKYYDDQDVIDMILPIIRNDFKIIETMDNRDRDKVLQSAITIMNGKNDNCNPKHVRCWKEYSSVGCDIKYFPGGHFYIDDNLNEIANYINKIGRKDVVML